MWKGVVLMHQVYLYHKVMYVTDAVNQDTLLGTVLPMEWVGESWLNLLFSNKSL